MTEKRAESGKKEAWQAVSSLTTIFEKGDKEGKRKVFKEEDGFGDNLQLIFKQDNTQQDEHLSHVQKPILHAEHGQGEPELRMEDSDQLSLDFDSAQQEMEHHHDLEQVRVDFKPAVETSEYGSQWLPVFSPSHRVA